MTYPIRSFWIWSISVLALLAVGVTDVAASVDGLIEIYADSTLSTQDDSVRYRSRIPRLQISPIALPYRRSTPQFLWIDGKTPQIEVRYDSAGYYVAEERISQTQRALPYYMEFNNYAQEQLRKSTYANWARLSQEQSNQQREEGGLLDFSVRIPGGGSSAIANIFGSDQVNLRITGTANFDLGANIQNTEDPQIPPDQRQQVDPIFNQNLKFNIQGTIGDKLTITTDWDTENAFEYQNRLRIAYEGYEDEIIKSIEMGNVAMETGNSLIRGGNALFGIKSRAELGRLSVTSVISQQRGEGNNQTFKGGAKEEELSIKPTDYEDDQHFFLDFYYRQEFEDAVSNPTINIQVLPLQQVQVWMLNESTQQIDGLRDAVAMVDLGVNQQGFSFSPPNTTNDGIDDALIEQYRDPQLGVTAATFGVEPEEFVQGKFQRLYEGQDYELNPNLGIITMKRRLGGRQAIAVQFQYLNAGTPVNIGDQAVGGNNRLFLKLIRPQNITTTNKAWDLTLRNIYSLNTTGLKQEDVELEINYLPENIPLVNIPGSSNPMIQDLGLDRVDQQGATRPDNLLDFGTLTFNSQTGRIMFPYLEPFGQRLREIVQASNSLSQAEKDEFFDKFVYDELYTDVKNIATRSSKNNFYRINAKVSGAMGGGSFQLGGFDIVEGSIVVRSGGVELMEGVDYEVDYTFGIVNITNSQYLSAGQEITIDYESNNATLLQQQSFMGVRTEYAFSDDIQLGGTIFRYNEQPNQDKVRIGDEPINNTLIGLDAKAQLDAPWLTRFMDRLPLISTKEASSISFEGEWAQLNPGVAQTPAVQRQIDRGTLQPDEENGISFIDDFEGAENTITFLAPQRWFLSSAPAAIPGYLPDQSIFTQDSLSLLPDGNLSAKTDRADLRAKFAWYAVDQSIGLDDGLSRTPESRVVRIQDVFPQRDVQANDQFLVTLDAYYDPTERGPYNYNFDLRNLTENQPERMWGGMTTIMNPGLQNLDNNNIEFLEFWVQFVLPDGREPTPAEIAEYEGKMYIDMGIISEDVIPNFKANTEDGLADRPGQLQIDLTGVEQPRSFVPLIPPTPNGEFALENQDIEDVGLDGIPSLPNTDLGEEKSEVSLFAPFIERMRSVYSDRPDVVSRIESDPSNDDYFFFRQRELDGLPLHERFHRMFGYHEGNSPVTQQGDKSAVTNIPDTEGLVIPSVIETNDSYFQYELDLNPADLQKMRINQPGTYIIDQVDNGSASQNWYQIRIPLRDFTRKFGEIDNFQNISYIRMWLSGYRQPFTMRFATFELVGSQWVKEEVINQETPISEFFVSTVNIEENGSKSPIPYREPRGAIRAINRTQQQQTLQNEQSIALQVEDLQSGGLKMIKRVLPSGQNFLNYSNLRMFVHGEGYENREDVELVVRLGNDLVNNYYEYRQPVSPSNPDYTFGRLGQGGSDNATIEADAEQVWLYDQNSMNIELTAFNQLKQLRASRTEQGVDFDPTLPFETSEVLQNAVPGAIVKIVGNPNLSNITEIGLGILNPHEPEMERGVPILDAELWLNELRVSGFDNTKGWAANAKANIKFADFASVNANITRETDGFGGITSKINERSLNNITNLNLSATVNLHKLLPARWGWNFPVTVNRTFRESTPRFVPNLGGDIRLDDAIGAIENNQQLSDEEKQVQLDDLIEQSETRSENFSVNVSNVSKKFSKNPIVKAVVDNTTLRFSYATSSSRDPNVSRNEGWNFNTGATYSYTFKNVKLFEPFRFLRNIPILKTFSDVGFGYLPSSINMGIAASRKYNERLQRPRSPEQQIPLQQTHTFNYNTNFALNYQFMRSIGINYQSNSAFDLSLASERNKGLTGLDSLQFDPVPTFEVIEGLVQDSLKPRRGTYSETWSANFRPQFIRYPFLDWLSYQATYSGGFAWTNAQRGADEQGASLNNTFRFDQSPSVNFQKLFEKVPFYKNMKLANEASEKDRAKRSEAKSKYKDQIKKEKERRRKEIERLEEYIKKVKTDSSLNRVLADSMAIEARNQIDTLKVKPFEEANLPEAEGVLKYFTRKFVLALLSPQNIDLSMNYSRSSAQGGYDGGVLLFDAFNDVRDDSYSPSFAYRTGFSTDIPADQLVGRSTQGTNLVIGRNTTEKNGFKVRTKIQPWRDLTVDLDWALDNDRTEQETINLFADTEREIQRVNNENGNHSSGVWAFGPGYRDLFERQLNRAYDDIADGTVINDSTGNSDGLTVLNPLSVKRDFITAYLGEGSRTIGDRGFGAFPMPNWSVNWSGVEKLLPFIGGAFSSISLSHKYTGRYRLSWSYFAAGGTELPSKSLGAYRVQDIQSFYEPTSITVEQNFQPLAQVNMNFKNGMRANLGYNYRKESTVSLANSGVAEKFNQGIKLGTSYTIRSLKLPFFPKLRNSMDINVQMSYNDDTQQRYDLVQDLAGALEAGPDELQRDPSLFEVQVQNPSGQTRFEINTIIGYQLSRSVKMNFRYRFEQITPKSSHIPKRSSAEIFFNLVMNIRSR